MSATTVFVTLQHVECEKCGVVFGMTQAFVAARRNDHKTLYCPNGHPLCYSQKSDLELANDALAREKHHREQAQAHAERMERVAAAERNSARTTRGHLTRIKRRVQHGVCPHCSRTFKQLAAHIQSKHPECLVEAPNA